MQEVEQNAPGRDQSAQRWQIEVGDGTAELPAGGRWELPGFLDPEVN